MKKKTLNLIIYVFLTIAFFLLIFLVWGKSLRLAKANRLLNNTTDPDGQIKARHIYENLLVDLPTSPYLLHNLGLAFYRAGQSEKALTHLLSAQEELEKLTLAPKQRRHLIHKFSYHYGNALFTTAEKPGNEDKMSGYHQSLEAFKKAIKADPTDHDAKYNYELALLQLEQKNKEQENKENQEKKDKSSPEDNGNNNQQNQEVQENEDKKDDSSQNAAEDNQEKQKNNMSKEEAIALLEMAESGALYQGPSLPEAPPSDKDW